MNNGTAVQEGNDGGLDNLREILSSKIPHVRSKAHRNCEAQKPSTYAECAIDLNVPPSQYPVSSTIMARWISFRSCSIAPMIDQDFYQMSYW